MKKQILSLILALCIVCIACAPAMASSEDSSASDVAEETVNPETVFQPVIDEFSEVITLGSDALEQLDSFTYVSDLGVGGYIPGSGTVYAFYDINDDGVPEMIVGMGADCGKRNILEVLYYEEGKIGELFNHAFFYRSGLHIGADGTVMQEGSVSAFCETMTIYSVKDSLSMPSQLESYYYDSSDNKMFTYMQEDGHSELSQADYYKAVNDFIMNGLDYSSLDWHFFVIPEGGEYDPYPGKMPEVSSTTNTISGLYVDSSSAQSPCQINFDSSNQTYILVMTNWYAYEVFEGQYSIDENGVIECVPDVGVSTYYNKVSGSDELWPVHYKISGNGETIIPVEDGLGEGDHYSRVSDGYSVNTDSGSGIVTGNAVRIRCGPGTDYFFFTELNSGNKVTIIGKCGEWYRVQCYDSYGNLWRGFIHSDYVSREGWYKEYGFWYYYRAGSMIMNNWVKDGGKWYWLDEYGHMVTGWRHINGESYYFNSSGVMQTGWINLGGGDYYYADGSGALVKDGWVKSGKLWYWLKSGGLMARSESLTINGVLYFFDGSGACLNP